MKIVPFKPEYRKYFEQLNRAWVEKYFTLEPPDRAVLAKPEENILNKGGQILFLEHEGQVVGTVALIFISEGIYELAKMSVREDFQGRGAGKVLCRAAIEEAERIHARKLVLFTNSGLKPALAIYRQLGFKEVELTGTEYARADVKMELILQS